MVVTVLNVPKHPKEHNVIRFRDYKKCNQDDFLRDLQSVNFDEVFLCFKPQNAWNYWKNKTLCIFDKHTPIREQRLKERRNPWISNEIIKMMCQRDSLHTGATKQTNTALWSRYKTVRNRVTTLINKAKQDYFGNVARE